ncbi:MAG: hypothetical protein WAN43_07045 [Rhodomicrobium sp.]
MFGHLLRTVLILLLLLIGAAGAGAYLGESRVATVLGLIAPLFRRGRANAASGDPWRLVRQVLTAVLLFAVGSGTVFALLPPRAPFLTGPADSTRSVADIIVFAAPFIVVFIYIVWPRSHLKKALS